MANKILFVVEGETKEPAILSSLPTFMPDESEKIVWCNRNHIYNFYQKINEDPDLDIFSLIKEENPDGPLKEYIREDFDQVYMFFDYDGHVGLSRVSDEPLGDDIIQLMLDRFDNETEEGKLFISYPMAEALEHTPIDMAEFRDLTAKCKGINCPNKETCPDRESCKKEPHYKKIVNLNKPLKKPIADYTDADWKRIAMFHIYKMEYLINGNMDFPSVLHSQQNIFKRQLEEYISRPCPVVSVLSGFPAFVLDYYGTSVREKLEAV
ncbi:MAG: hypothetical protein NC349_02150 [Paenibacillus sp.]|nr:hypothetical protein [Paenibacillus sp.]